MHSLHHILCANFFRSYFGHDLSTPVHAHEHKKDDADVDGNKFVLKILHAVMQQRVTTSC